jgi:hypothetical protein
MNEKDAGMTQAMVTPIIGADFFVKELSPIHDAAAITECLHPACLYYSQLRGIQVSGSRGIELESVT